MQLEQLVVGSVSWPLLGFQEFLRFLRRREVKVQKGFGERECEEFVEGFDSERM